MTHDQAEDRAHRIDPLKQKRDEVRCIYFLGENTIDIALANFIERKRNLTRTGISGDTSLVIPEGRINAGCGEYGDFGEDVGGFIKSLIKSDKEVQGLKLDIDVGDIDPGEAFQEILEMLEEAEEEERLAKEDEDFKLFQTEERQHLGDED